ncbi:MAG: hypothetical protein KGJ59_05100 [Bacteroidota bacterium]|nr:hypothetical protein [Bacteroidota bacterium]
MPIFFPTLLYAETHYRFKYFFSLLKKREPEILADLPYRLEPTAELPILLLVKDAHHYPIELVSASATIVREADSKQISHTIVTNSISINEPLWWKIVNVPWSPAWKNSFGFFSIDIRFEYKINKKLRRCRNDNYRTSSKKSYRVFRSADPLPSLSGWIQGDVHTHSSYSNDQVEFGSPVEASVELCKAMGLSFFCVTDHSYDLDDRIDNYLVNDPDVPKWKSLQKEIDAINAREKNYFAGSGDSGERWLHTQAEHTISEVLEYKKHTTAAYAAHPAEPVPLLQRIFVGRGEWTLDDMRHEKLNGLQILNGETGETFERGLSTWKKLLLEGERLYIAAGNDAHGNFNRFRQIKIPFVKIVEADKQLFGKMRTVVECSNSSEENIVEALRSGAAMITNGPVAVFHCHRMKNELAITVRGISTKEFGAFTRCIIYSGRSGGTAEKILFRADLQKDFQFEFTKRFDASDNVAPHYIRFEAFTHGGSGINENGFCFTNPMWLTAKR